jgi:hypothetical protein
METHIYITIRFNLPIKLYYVNIERVVRTKLDIYVFIDNYPFRDVSNVMPWYLCGLAMMW